MERAVLQELLAEGLSLAEIGRRLDRHESDGGVLAAAAWS
jgi:IS30 family transposase